jgi:cytochrome c-type biogenesis protein
MGGRATHTAAAQTLVITAPTVTNRISTFIHGLAFVAGFTFIFVVFGLLTTALFLQLGSNIAIAKEIIGRAGGLLIIFFGLHFTGLLRRGFKALLKNETLLANPLFSIVIVLTGSALIIWAFVDILIALPLLAVFLLWAFLGGAFVSPQPFWTGTITKLQTALYADTRRQMVAQGKQNYASSVLMGVIFAAGWTPCIGPIYGSILTIAASGSDTGGAGSLMVAYSLGLGIPFLLTALLLDSATSIMRRLKQHVHKIEVASGAFLIVIGILVASGQIQRLSLNFSNQFADFSYRVEACATELGRGEITLGDFFICINTDTEEIPATASS